MRKGSLQSKFLVKVGILSQRGGLGGWLVWPNPNFLKPKPQPYKTVILSQYGGGSPLGNFPSPNKKWYKKSQKITKKMGLFHEQNNMLRIA